MKKNTILLLLIVLLVSCKDEKGKENMQGETANKSSDSGNSLSFEIDGKLWEADSDVSGTFHVAEELGPGTLTISGQKGSGSAQQDFTITLYNTTGPGTYTVSIGNGSKQNTYQNVAQLANLTESNYMCGGALQGSNLNVVVTKANKNPQEVEATFSGTLQCVEGNIINITNGKFYYHE